MLPRLVALGFVVASAVAALFVRLPVSIEGSYAVHLLTGALLTGALTILLRGRLLLAVACAVAAAIGLELVQAAYLIGRSGDLLDALAGIAGSLLVALIVVARRGVTKGIVRP